MTVVQPSLLDPAHDLTSDALPYHRNDPDTSVEAANKAAVGAKGLRRRILTHLASHADGATAEELWQACGGKYPHVAGTRVGTAEMACEEWCVKNGYPSALTYASTDRRDGRIVWKLTAEGQRAARAVRSTAA